MENGITGKLKVQGFEEGRFWLVDDNGPVAKMVCDNEKKVSDHIAKCVNAHEETVSAIKNYCERVEKGEVRSVKTYAKFKELLKQLE